MKYSVFIVLIFLSCSTKRVAEQSGPELSEAGMRIIIDSDANNELDDQHALAYAFSNPHVFAIEGITVNNTRFGDGIEGQYDEAMRIMKLFNVEKSIPLLKGASGSYADIVTHIDDDNFDGHEAVNFIIAKAMEPAKEKLVLVPVGKLTNIALALKKAPQIKDKVRIVWLGSNFPDEGEYNLDNDTTAVNPVIESGVPFEMVVVRYGMTTGSHAVSVSKDMINDKMKGVGPQARQPITGRHGGEFSRFGDYSIDLFSHIELHGDPPSRALYDMVALAILKNPSWGQKNKIPPSRLRGIRWESSSSATQNVSVWENFAKEPILDDFFSSLANSHQLNGKTTE
jgi:purine nucleosidase